MRGYFAGGVCRSTARLDGRSAIITGGNTGIGKETAIDLAKRGADVIIACRSKERGEAAVKDIKEQSCSDKVELKILDLASFSSIRKFAADINSNESSKIHLLINNAGVMLCPFMKTEDGFEMQFGTNHLGHFLLTNLLLDKVKASAPSRIVNVSSLAHYKGHVNFDDLNGEKAYSSMKAYQQSKLCNVLFTNKLHQMLHGDGVSCYSLHPGVINTELGRYVQEDHPWIYACAQKCFGWVMKTPKEGAQTTLHCAVTEGLETESGKYFSDCAVKDTNKEAKDQEVIDKLWEVSLKLTGLDKDEE